MPKITRNEVLAKLREKMPEAFEASEKLSAAAFKEGQVPLKHKAFAAALLAAVKGCEPCVKHYLKMAHEAGGECKDFFEFLAVLMAVDGCVGKERGVSMALAWKDIAHCCEEEAPKGGCCGKA